jgi:hypothetical protein
MKTNSLNRLYLHNGKGTWGPKRSQGKLHTRKFSCRMALEGGSGYSGTVDSNGAILAVPYYR